jgi:hypothetical protein
LPRKYHRPPPVKRRKSKRTATAEDFARDLPAPVLETAVAVGVADTENNKAVVDNTPVAAVGNPVTREAAPIRRINQDYSYVRGEIVQIAIIGGLIILGLVITSFFR